MNIPVAVIGLGIMGSQLANRLIRAGFAVRGYDPDSDRMASFVEAGGTAATSPGDAVGGCRLAVLSLLTSDVSRAVCLGHDGIAAAGVAPLLVLDTTTGPPHAAIEIGTALAGFGVDYADMTISGNAAVAERGELVVMFGGSDAAYQAAIPVMEAIGRSNHHVGPVGSGATMKLIVNHVLAVNRAALAEGLVVAELAGVDLGRTLEILRDGAAYSRAMDLWGPRMATADHEEPDARLSQSYKDCRVIVAQARDHGAPAGLIGVVEQMLAEGINDGLGDLDNSSVIEVVRRRAGVGRVPRRDGTTRPGDPE